MEEASDGIDFHLDKSTEVRDQHENKKQTVLSQEKLIKNLMATVKAHSKEQQGNRENILLEAKDLEIQLEQLRF